MSGSAFPYKLVVKFAFGAYAIGDQITDPTTILAIEASPYATYVVQDFVLPAPASVTPPSAQAPVYVSSVAVAGYVMTVLYSDGTSSVVALPVPPTAQPVTLASITDIGEFQGTPGNVLSMDISSKLLDEPLVLSAITDVSEYAGTPGNLLALDATGKAVDVAPVMASIRDLQVLTGPPLSSIIVDADGNIGFQALGTPTLTITTPASGYTGIRILLTGGCTGATPAAMDYSIDSGTTWFAMTPFSSSGGTWSGGGPTPPSPATITVRVRDHGNQSIQATSGSISIVSPVGEVLSINSPTGATQGVIIPLSGTYAGGVPLAMDYSVNAGASWVGIAGFTAAGGIWAGSGPAPSTPGSMTITVRDHTVTTSTATTAAFIVVSSLSGAAMPVISSPLFGLDAQITTGQFFQDQQCSVPAGFGNAVGGFASVITSSDQMIADSNTTPSLVATAHGGLPGLRFSSAAQTLLYPSPFHAPAFINVLDGNAITPAPMTIMAAFTPASVPTAAKWMSIFSAGVSATANVDRITLGLSPTDVHFSVSVPGRSNSVSVPLTPAVNGLIKVVARFTDFVTPIYLAVVGQVEASLQPQGSMDGTAWNAAWIGGAMQSGAPYQSFDGWLHELRIWSSAASPAQRDLLLGYATAKWGS